MPISTINITNLRNINEIQLSCSSTLNIFYGMNAAGKTSLLEAIHFLSTAKSFRTNQIETIVKHKANGFSVSASLLTDGVDIPVGIQKTSDGSKQIRINQEKISSIATLSQLLPTQFIGTNSQRLLLEGPKIRRQVLDWGLFHTNPDFYSAWKAFQKILAQRNAALKNRTSKSEMLTWNANFIQAAEKIDAFRKSYLDTFTPYFLSTASTLLHDQEIVLSYQSGWPEDVPLAKQLSDSFFREQHAGFSLFGPQRAELAIFANHYLAHDTLSQGQQKLLCYAMRLAQGIHLQATTEKPPIYLIDDLPSELDHKKRALVFKLLSDINAQVFVTAIDPNQISDFLTADHIKMFHVKHGEIVAN